MSSRALDAVFEPVHPPTTFEETVERLGTAIRLGLLAPGTRLPAERELSAQLGISRSTLRMALTTLVQSGHLVSRRGRAGGTFVADEPPLVQPTDRHPLLSEHARAVLDYRLAVETGAALLAAERATRADLERLDGFVTQMATAEGASFPVYRRADVRFHIGLAEATHSPKLVAAMTEAQGQMTDLIDRLSRPGEVLGRSNEQHERVVELLRERDGGSAVEVLRAHCAGTERIIAGRMTGPAA